MRRLIVLTGFVFCSMVVNTFAETVYRLQPGDVLRVWIAQEQERDAEVSIGPDGWTSFPLAGHIKGAGLTVSELEAALVDRIKPFYKESPNLTLMLQPREQHLPLIFVTGDVVTPGEYPYRQNMAVLHGVAVAGGLYRTTMLPADQDRSVVVQRDIESAEIRLKQLKLLILRLNAELVGNKTISSKDIEPTDPLLLEEQRLLDENLKSAERQDAAQKQAKELGARNSKALSDQIETVATRLKLARVQLDRIAGLVTKGAAGSAMQTVQEGVIAELEGQTSAMKAGLIVAERARIAEDAAFESARQERKTRLLLGIQAAQREAQEREASLEDSRRIMKIYREAATENQQVTDRTVVYRILRIVNGKAEEFQVSETSMLTAGDLLRVIYEDTPRSSNSHAAEVQLQEPDTLREDSTTTLSGVSQ